jgi:hypothetical protein
MGFVLESRRGVGTAECGPTVASCLEAVARTRASQADDGVLDSGVVGRALTRCATRTIWCVHMSWPPSTQCYMQMCVTVCMQGCMSVKHDGLHGVLHQPRALALKQWLTFDAL